MDDLKVRISTADIENGGRTAMSDPITDVTGGVVSSTEIRVGDDWYLMPASAIAWLEGWDNGREVSPIRFVAKHYTAAERQARIRAERYARRKRIGGLANFRRGERIEPETALVGDED